MQDLVVYAWAAFLETSYGRLGRNCAEASAPIALRAPISNDRIGSPTLPAGMRGEFIALALLPANAQISFISR